ncbi:MAG TPA: VOC family protein [Polyangiales bacterium]|jgi:catechol 2,3-dioxygenase-like lactoylglutathione lyase family enzyme/mannose-6-phosphate isomerase-like protein (cupin superfamily)|nr:VOC family protein [Polyangiales bacterium]
MDLEVTGIDHLYISVRDLQTSERFYDPVMQALGFRKNTRAIGGEPHAHYFNHVMQYTLRPARDATDHDPYRVGALHHLCFQVRDQAAVDEAHRRLRALGIDASAPALYPEYRPDYYATFFTDPNGIRLEVLAETAGRRLIRDRWHELTDFVDPVSKLSPAAMSSNANLFAGETPATGEAFDVLAQLGDTTIERIMSSAAPATELYDQEQDEWVVLLRGAAELEVAGKRTQLRPGDHVTLPSRTPHRVLSTAAGSLWLAVHVRKQA